MKAARQVGIEVNFKYRLSDLKTENERAALNFENGASASDEIVIAADGINSRTRDACGIEFKKIAIGEGWIRGASQIELSKTAFREIWGDDGRRFGIALLTGGQTYFYARVPLGEWQAIRENQLAEWIESWREFGGDALDILRQVGDWEKINYSELFEIHAPVWAKPPVFLVGDAAHAMTPNIGQGANSAMVDALILVQMLKRAEKSGKSLTEVGGDYTNLRRPFVTKLQNTARRSGALAAKTSASAHFARNLLFAASKNLGFLRRQNLLLSAGYNPPENEYFTLLNNENQTAG